MKELMVQMTSWLLASMFLGFIIAWFLSHIIYRRRQNSIEDMFDKLIREQNSMIKKLENDFRTQQEAFEKLSTQLESSNEALAKKSSLVTTLQNKLDKTNPEKGVNLILKEENSRLSIRNKELEELDRKRVMELKNFEEVVVLAETKMQESERVHFQVVETLNEEIEELRAKNEKYQQRLKEYEKRIKVLEEQLKLYKAEHTDSEFIISRDQFVSIEAQLKKYQEEIVTLKRAKEELLVKLEKRVMGA
jgi:chromosome segregation ATPase